MSNTETADRLVAMIAGLLPSTDDRPRPWRAGPAGRASGARCLDREEAEAEAERYNAIRARSIAAGILTEAAPRWVAEYRPNPLAAR